MNNRYLSSSAMELDKSTKLLVNSLIPDIRQTIYSLTPHCSFFSDLSKFLPRVDSFYKSPRKWRSLDNLKATPTTLAEAGFSYTQWQDIVQCYKCKIYLGNWFGHNIDPLGAHAAWSPDCPFVKINAPEYFIDVYRRDIANANNKFHFDTFTDPVDLEALQAAQIRVFVNTHPNVKNHV